MSPAKISDTIIKEKEGVDKRMTQKNSDSRGFYVH
jgi:hypothetical protein